MKKKLFLAVLLLVSSTTFAQNTSTSQIEKQNTVSSEGFRASLLRSDLDAKIKIEYAGKTFTGENENIDTALGVAVGYASLPIQQLGWTANFAYMKLKADDTSVKMGRVDANLAYAFNSLINIKGGLNVSKLSVEDGTIDYKPAVGLQLGFGLQFTKNFGLDVSYVQMRNTIDISADISAEDDTADGTVTLDGSEIALTGTF